MTAALPEAVDFQQERAQLFSHAPAKIFLGHIASASALIYLASDVLSWPWLAAWSVLEILITPAALYYLGRRANEGTADLDRWQQQLHILFVVVGSSWGLFLFFSLDVENPAHFSMQMAIAAGATAASTRSLGIFMRSFLFYEIPFLGLLSLRIFTLGGDYILLGGLVLIFMVMMYGLAEDTNQALTKYLTTKSENRDLAAKFAAAASDADRANAAKSRFLAQANHDLRQPVHAIGLLTESLRAHPLNADARDTLETIDQSVGSLSKLFKSLLNISALDSDGLQPEVTEFPLDDVISQIIRQARPEALENGCTLLAVSTSVQVRTDQALLTSILQNLVFNAVKYAPGSRILIGAKREGGGVGVHVLDQGPGVPKYLQEEIFTEFVRGNPNGPGRVDGLGLGLSIVRRTSALLNLQVAFNSVEGAGTHVAVHGLKVADTPAKPHSGAEASTQQNLPEGLRVLVVDDNRNVLTGLGKLLSGWGYQAITCLPGETLPDDPDILLMDYHLNRTENGIELARQLRERRKRPIPTAIISGTVSDDIRNSALAEGFQVLQKPVTPIQLRSVLLAMAQDERGQAP